MRLFKLSKDDLLNILNEGRKKILTELDVFSDEIKLSLLKKIDHIFEKGIYYYVDFNPITESSDESIFFRKSDFNSTINLGARKIVNRFEEEKIAFATLAKLSDFKLKRTIKLFKFTDNPKQVAFEVREYLYPDFKTKSKDFLKSFISKLAENNILVFEFIETHNKKEKANIDGFYLVPNVIVIKRNQKSLKREVFTLAHELGHYLLNEEDIDENTNEYQNPNKQLSEVEKWCNDFAYFFLVGKHDITISNLSTANPNNDYHRDLIDTISASTHLSSLSLYTRLLISGKISMPNYESVKADIIQNIKDWEIEEKRKMELEKEKALDEGRKLIIPAPKPIFSPLYLKTLQNAVNTGLLNEADFCRKLNLKPENIDTYFA